VRWLAPSARECGQAQVVQVGGLSYTVGGMAFTEVITEAATTGWKRIGDEQVESLASTDVEAEAVTRGSAP
jgi:hypothetical protein